jgi:hypothetical protein
MRQSMNFQTARTRKIVKAVAIRIRIEKPGRFVCRASVSDAACTWRFTETPYNHSDSVSIRSARAKSSSVRPPLLWVDKARRTLL